MHDLFLYQGFYPLHSKLPTRCTAISINYIFILQIFLLFLQYFLHPIQRL